MLSRRILFRGNFSYCRLRYFATATETEAETEADTSKEKDPLSEEERDISRMRPYHRSKLHGKPAPSGLFKWQEERWAQKAAFASHGLESGVDPGMMWPSVQEVKGLRKAQKETHPDLEEMMEALHQKREQEKEDRIAWLADIDKRKKQYRKLVTEYRAEEEEKRTEQEENLEIQNNRIREIQQMFGYAADTSDPRFQALLERRELEEKKAIKLRRKQEKRDELINKLKAAAEALKVKD